MLFRSRYECGGYIYSGEGQELGQFWAKLNVGNAKLQKTSSNTSITDGNGNYSIAGATYGVFADKDCTKQLATLTTDKNGNTDVVEVIAGTVYIKELSAPAGYKVDKTVYSLKIEAGKTATLNVSDTPKVTDTLIELFKIDMETKKDNPQGNTGFLLSLLETSPTVIQIHRITKRCLLFRYLFVLRTGEEKKRHQ